MLAVSDQSLDQNRDPRVGSPAGWIFSRAVGLGWWHVYDAQHDRTLVESAAQGGEGGPSLLQPREAATPFSI